MTLTDTGESRIRGYLFVLGRSLRTFLPGDAADDAVREVESHVRERIEQIAGREPGERRAEAGLPGRPAKAGDRRIEQIAGREPGERRAEAGPPGRPAKAAERDVVERVLAELGPPLRVAQAYSQEMTLDEALTTGRFVPMVRALWHAATSSVYGFAWGIFVLIGCALGVALLAVAVLKPIFPDNVGLIVGGSASTHGVEVFSVPRLSIDAFSLSERVSFGAQFPLPPGAHVYGGYWVVPIGIVAGLLALVLTYRLSKRMLGWLRSRRPPARVRVRLVVESRRG